MVYDVGLCEIANDVHARWLLICELLLLENEFCRSESFH